MWEMKLSPLAALAFACGTHTRQVANVVGYHCMSRVPTHFDCVYYWFVVLKQFTFLYLAHCGHLRYGITTIAYTNQWAKACMFSTLLLLS